MRVLSRLPDRSMFGLHVHKLHASPIQAFSITHFSSDVARLVTHPLWPTRVPRITNCSAILGNSSSEDALNLLKGKLDNTENCNELSHTCK